MLSCSCHLLLLFLMVVFFVGILFSSLQVSTRVQPTIQTNFGGGGGGGDGGGGGGGDGGGGGGAVIVDPSLLRELIADTLTGAGVILAQLLFGLSENEITIVAQL
jgi:hypothetical protein